MRKIIDLKGVFDYEKTPIMKNPIEGLLEFDGIITTIQGDSMEVISASMAVESLVLGVISRALELPCHEPSEDIPYWWLQLEMSCGGVLTLKALDQSARFDILNDLTLEEQKKP